jgi:hypothetical protein
MLGGCLRLRKLTAGLFKNFLIIPSGPQSMWSQPEKLFSHNFSCFCCDESNGKGPLLLGKPYGSRKCAKKASFTFWPPAETNFLRPVQKVGQILLRRGAGLTYHSFLGDDQIIFKSV